MRDPNSRHKAAPADRTIARLRQQVDALRNEVAGLRQALRAAAGNSLELHRTELVEANGALVLAALHAEQVAESAIGELDQLSRTSQRDALTGTPNRALMLDRLEGAIALARRRGTRAALLFVDLDRFKQINDTLGHAVGDTVLRLVTQRLEAAVRDSDSVSRHGGDEFLVLLAEVSQTADAGQIAAKMLLAIGEPGPEPLPAVSASIGIAIYPEDGREAAVLIANADAAMYRSKKHGPGGFAFHAERASGAAAAVPVDLGD